MFTLISGNSSSMISCSSVVMLLICLWFVVTFHRLTPRRKAHLEVSLPLSDS